LVLKYTRKYSSYGIARDELMAVGNLALCETANRFEPGKGFKFSTYASHWIKGTMLIFIASNYFSFTLKSQKMKKIFFTLRREIHKAQKQNKELENPEQIMHAVADQFGCTPTQLEQIWMMIRQPNLSLDEPFQHSHGDTGESSTLGDTIACEDPNPEETVIDNSMDEYRRELIHSTMDRVLNEREKIIIRGQMLMEEDQERTLQDLADEFKLSRERVRQIRNNAYEKLERAIRKRCAHIDSRAFL
jgi:RNA polymerase sigma-32 factor